MFSRKGNAIVEYILPVALVLLVSYPLWQAVSQGFGNGLKTVFGNTNSTSTAIINP